MQYFVDPKARAKEIEDALKALPLAEKIRALAIYRYYQEIKKIDELKDKEIKEVEKKYLKLEDPIIKGQNGIISGERAVTLDDIKQPELYLTEEERKDVDKHLGARKIPEYWVKAMQNCEVLSEEIKPNDVEALKHLHNIHVIDEEGTDNFEMVFTFNENPFFKNKELRKKFTIKDNFPIKAEGTVIEWEQGKDLTKKEMKKKQKNKKSGQTRTITKIVDADSFFNFFGTILITEENDLEVDEAELKRRERMGVDFEIGGAIVDECVPYSLEYYLGVKSNAEEDDMEDDEDDEDEDEEEEEEKKPKSKGKPAAGKGGKGGEKPECKQQ